MITLREAADLGPKSTTSGGASQQATRLFNAAPALVDAHLVAHPYLAEDLPRLNSENWRVFADGRMESIYTLRSGLTWHDGAPLTASDFVFAWKIYTTPGLTFSPRPQDQIEEVVAVNDRTLRIEWESPYPYADALVSSQYPPLPSHILASSLQDLREGRMGAEAFSNLAFWRTEYVGAGPFRLQRWEPGAFMEALAFDGHALGRPKIDRLIIRTINDANAALAALLAGELDFVPKSVLRFDQLQALRRDWIDAGRGSVLVSADQTNYAIVQFRPEYQQEPGLLDPRVRRALAYGVDRQALLDGLYDGQGEIMYTFVPSTVSYFADVNRAITKYDYSPQRVRALMNEAGFTVDRESVFADSGGRRFQPDFRVAAGPPYDRGQAIIVDTWHRLGLDVQPSVLPQVQVTSQDRQTFRGIYQGNTTDDEVRRLARWSSAEVGTAANRWAGNNWSGWSNAEYDRLFQAFTQSLDRKERDRLAVQMLRVLSEELPGSMLYSSPNITAHVAALRGPEAEPSDLNGLGPFWNIQEWDLN
jgi:peptide/nickel transport system substrate-binding protein